VAGFATLRQFLAGRCLGASRFRCDAFLVFERFDERAYEVVVLAGIEARDRRFSHVGTESLLVGLLLEAEARTGIMSGPSSVLLERVREVIGQRVGALDKLDPEARVIDLTPRAREVFRHAEDEAAHVGAEHEHCGQSSTSPFRCVLTGSGLAYDKFDAVRAPVGSSFSRRTLLAYIAHARATGAMSATAAATFRADLARVPDSFFTEYRLASRYGTYGSGSSNSHGQNLVPPPGQPNVLVCQNAGHGLSCRDLNGPIGAGVYAAEPGPGWRVAPPQTQPGGLPPGIHFTRAEYQVLIDMLRYATVGHVSHSDRG
jgi:hypothetical protein